jgi:fumarate hydratase class I
MYLTLIFTSNRHQQSVGGSFVTLAKGNRSKAVTKACKDHGGFYLGSIGGPAAILAQNCIKKVEVLEYPELGMEVCETNTGI